MLGLQRGFFQIIWMVALTVLMVVNFLFTTLPGYHPRDWTSAHWKEQEIADALKKAKAAAESAERSAAKALRLADGSPAQEGLGRTDSEPPWVAASSAAALRNGSGAGGDGKAASAVLERQRQRLAAWVSNFATLEEVRMLELLQGFLLQSPRGDTWGRPFEENFSQPLRWLPCAAEHDNCDCATGHMRYGTPEAGWVVLDRRDELRLNSKKASVSVPCETTAFKGDTAPKSVKMCQCEAALCDDGSVADWRLCGGRATTCSAACPPRLPSPRGRAAAGRTRDGLCKGGVAHELLWSCDPTESRLPSRQHAHWQAQDVLSLGMEELCDQAELARQVETFLDCNFLDSYLRWTDQESEWLQEAYVSYIGGARGSAHERRITNLIRSIHAFSSRPLVLVVMDDIFEPPLHWRELPNLIVYKMHPCLPGMPFNFNKVRAMVAARVVTGIELDGDQIIFAGMDRVFAPTRRECTAQYPFPILPVHFMSKEPGKREIWFNNRWPFTAWNGTKSMRYCHAHPSWTFWALPFLTDLLLLRLVALKGRGRQVHLWRLSAGSNLYSLLRTGDQGRSAHAARQQPWMSSDEPMLNVMLWKAKANKSWCKFDLEPNAFLRRTDLPQNHYYDSHWYPDGVPLTFFSLHNTKNSEEADHLLSFFVFCSKPAVRSQLQCPPQQSHIRLCARDGQRPLLYGSSLAERNARTFRPEQHLVDFCCCLEPRLDKPFFWGGNWYRTPDEVPVTSPGEHRKPRLCIIAA